MELRQYFTIDYDLARSEGFISPAGCYVRLTPNDKILYSYMKARLKYFVEEKKGEYYDSQESVADALNMDIKSARRCLTSFINHGILRAEKKKFSNYYNWRYLELSPLLLWVKGKDGTPQKLCAKVISNKRSKDVNTPDFYELPF